MALFKNIPRKVVLLSWVSFLADVSSEMAYPLIPIFIVGTLQSPAFALGLIEGAAQALVSVMSAASGFASDKIKKRALFVRWGYGLPIIGKSLVAGAIAWPMVLLGRSVDRFGKGLRSSPRDALLAEAAGAEDRGRAFGFHRMMDTAGAFIGVALSGLALWLINTGDINSVCRIVLWGAAAFALFSFAASLLVTDEPAKNGNPSSVSFAEFLKAARSLSREYWITLIILSVFSFANSSDAFLLLRASDLGFSPLSVVAIYALYNAVYSLLSYPAGILSDKIGRWPVITIGWAVYAAVYAAAALGSIEHIWIIFAAYGAYMALTDGISKALAADSAPAELRGTAIGLLYLALGLSALTSNLTAGLAWDHLGREAPFWIGSGFALLAIAMVLFSGRLFGGKRLTTTI